MRTWLPLVAISLGSVMLMVDVTIVNVALPAMAVDLSSSFSSLPWVIDAYALALAVLLIGAGAVGDDRGHRRVYLAGLGVFALASIACGLAPTSGVLIAARAVQGAGAAAMFATTFALINGSYTGRDRGIAYGVFSAISGAAAALGPVVGGLLTQALSWRWIFFVNVPVSILTVLLTLAVVPAAVGRGGRRGGRRGGHRGGPRLDVPGIAAFTVAAASLTVALVRSAEDGWTSPLVLGLLVVALLALAGFVAVEARVAAPLVALPLFRAPSFTGAVLAAFVLSFSAYGVLTYTTIWTQSLLGLSPTESGLVALPLPVLVVVLSVLCGRVMHRLPRSLAIGGGVTLIGVGGLVSALLVTPQAGWGALIPGLVLAGVGIGFAGPTLARTATEAVGDDRAGMASGAVNTARQLGQAFGIALLGSLAAARAASSLRTAGAPDPVATSGALVGGQARSVLDATSADRRAPLDRLLHAAFAAGLDVAFIVAGVAALAVGLLVAVMLRRVPSDEAAASDEVSASDGVGSSRSVSGPSR